MNNITLSNLLTILGLLVLAAGLILLQAYLIYHRWPTKRVVRSWVMCRYEWVGDVEMWVQRNYIETEE